MRAHSSGVFLTSPCLRCLCSFGLNGESSSPFPSTTRYLNPQPPEETKVTLLSAKNRSRPWGATAFPAAYSRRAAAALFTKGWSLVTHAYPLVSARRYG